jgi:hypothetical protein
MPESIPGYAAMYGIDRTDSGETYLVSSDSGVAHAVVTGDLRYRNYWGDRDQIVLGCDRLVATVNLGAFGLADADTIDRITNDPNGNYLSEDGRPYFKSICKNCDRRWSISERSKLMNTDWITCTDCQEIDGAIVLCSNHGGSK